MNTDGKPAKFSGKPTRIGLSVTTAGTGSSETRAMKKTISIFGALIVCGLIRLHGGPVSLEPGEILELRQLVATNAAAADQFASIRREADAALKSVPNPVEKIYSEGTLTSDPRKIRTEKSLADLDKIEALGWAWAVTEDGRYASKAREFMLAWAAVNHPDGDAINETKFEPFIVSYDLLRGTFSGADRQRVDDWLRTKATVLWDSHRGLTENWYSHRLKIVGLTGWTIGDQTLVNDAVDGFHKQINRNIKADGATTDYYKRDALHYHIYDVEPLLTLARAAARSGQDLFDYSATNGATLKSGVDFVVPFANGSKTHLEFVHSTVPFDLKRARDGEREYAPHPWKPRTAVELFSDAAWFRPEYGELAATLAGQPGETFFNWQMVINGVSHPAGAGKG